MLDHKHSEHQIHDYNNQFEVARRKEKKKRKPLKPSQYALENDFRHSEEQDEL